MSTRVQLIATAKNINRHSKLMVRRAAAQRKSARRSTDDPRIIGIGLERMVLDEKKPVTAEIVFWNVIHNYSLVGSKVILKLLC